MGVIFDFSCSNDRMGVLLDEKSFTFLAAMAKWVLSLTFLAAMTKWVFSLTFLAAMTKWVFSLTFLAAMTKWVFGWIRNGWKLSNGGDVINREDFETLQKACRGIRVTYVSTYVKINKKN